MGRVTLDSAPAFLFGHDFRSLAEPLSYPFHVPRNSDSDSHSDPTFAPAFEAQDITNIRMRYLDFWPRILEDKIKEPMRFLERFLNPIVDGVVAKRRAAKSAAASSGGKIPAEPETLLEHLVEYGGCVPHTAVFIRQYLVEWRFSFFSRHQNAARRAAQYLCRYRHLPYHLFDIHARGAP
jgi:hypothetical protein